MPSEEAESEGRPVEGVGGVSGPPPADEFRAEGTSEVEEHLHTIVEELHHGKGSHDDPDLPDGPTEDPDADEDIDVSDHAAPGTDTATGERPDASLPT